MRHIILILLVLTFSTKISAIQPDTINNADEIKFRLSKIINNEVKLERLANFLWSVQSDVRTFKFVRLVKLENDTLYFFSSKGLECLNINLIESISYKKDSLLIPGAILGSIAGAILGGYGGNKLSEMKILSRSGSEPFSFIFGAMVGGIAGAGIFGRLGSLISITDDYSYSEFALEDKRKLMTNELFPSKQDKIKETDTNKLLFEASNNQILSGLPLTLGIEFNSSFYLTISMGYLFSKNIGVQAGFSNPGYKSFFLWGDYYLSADEDSKHVISLGVCNTNAFPIFYDRFKYSNWEGINTFAGLARYQYSFYGFSMGLGASFPLKRDPTVNVRSVFFALGYIYCFK